MAGSLKPGGRLIYAVCTLTRAETTGVADAFAAAHPELEPLPLSVPSVAPAPTAPPGNTVFLWPHEHASNGMFVAAWRRK